MSDNKQALQVAALKNGTVIDHIPSDKLFTCLLYTSRVRRLYCITADMGGKTGTTNRNSDGWFMGFTPSLVSGVWVDVYKRQPL